MEIKKEWGKFLKFIREKHNLTEDWIPDYYSIKIWEEYRCTPFKKEKKCQGQEATLTEKLKDGNGFSYGFGEV